MKKVSVKLNSLSAVLICTLFLTISIGAQEVPRFMGRTLGSHNSFSSDSVRLPATHYGAQEKQRLLSLVLPILKADAVTPPQFFINEASSMLYREITKRLGVRYRFYGTDDRGYDCSGFVWRVFQSAGSDFERVAARSLWAQLPEANDEEKGQFGTLVFFNGLRHVGIVRDSKTFYHASRSQGVTLSTFDGYWGGRITGFRRAPARLSLIP
ncbi:MAG: hypothetical protein RIR52_2335 [Acidobacteriota bacterium]